MTFVLVFLGLGGGVLSVQGDVLVWNWTADQSQVKNGPNSDGSTGSSATGEGFLRYDSVTNEMTVRYAWNNLFGELTKLHIHGRATASQSNPQHLIETFGPPDIPSSVNLNTDVWTATFPLTALVQSGFDPLLPEDIIAVMRDGLAYVNIHSSVFGTGEIRGNLGLPVPEPGSALLVGIGCLWFGLVRRCRR